MKLFRYNYRYICATAMVAALEAAAAPAVSWEGAADKVIAAEAPAASGLEAVYVFSSLQGVEARVDGAATWYSYSNLGGGYAEEVASGTDRLTDIKGDMGYIVEQGTERAYFWVVDHSRYPVVLRGLTPDVEDRDCSTLALAFDGSCAEIPYYGVNGRRFILSREMELAYTTLAPDAEALAFNPEAVKQTLESVGPTVRIPAPLCATTFTLSGDRFLREWGHEADLESETIEPHAVAALYRVEQAPRESDNEVKPSTDDLGGSAPCEVNFRAAVTDAALFHEWQFSRYPEFDDIDLRFPELDFTYTFTEEGATYIRFVYANADATCESQSDVWTLSIGSSMLQCPNAFSPGNADGVNDVWKVSYSSIVDFECHIFDRAGRKIHSFTNPSDGWDGKYKGKLVPAGVYYYVIKATGADGKSYDRAGDINIVNYK